MKGTVTNFVSCLQAGYIDGDDGQRYFVHAGDFNGGKMSVGMPVEFIPEDAGEGKRLRAKDVKTLQG